jgi:RHS repeat-associated protein
MIATPFPRSPRESDRRWTSRSSFRAACEHGCSPGRRDRPSARPRGRKGSPPPRRRWPSCCDRRFIPRYVSRRLSGYSVNRYYDPATAVFLSVDPIVASTHQAYDYAAQDPINGYDLDGTIVKGRDEGDANCASSGHGLGGCSDSYNSPGYVDAASSSPVLKAFQKAATIARHYGAACVANGAIGAIANAPDPAGSVVSGFAAGCATGVVITFTDRHVSKTAAAAADSGSMMWISGRFSYNLYAKTKAGRVLIQGLLKAIGVP